MSDDGDTAITLIAMLGSVFSPAYAKARRASAAADPLEHCTMNVAIYGKDESAWCLTERGRDDVRMSGHSLRIARSEVRWQGDELVFDIDERRAPFGGLVRGQIRFRAAGWTGRDVALDARGEHRWYPLSPAGRLVADLESPSMRFHGHGYLDANAGTCGLEESFRGWSWSRAVCEDGSALVAYDVVQRDDSRRSICLSVRPDGSVQERAPLTQHPLPSTWWGIDRSIRGDAGCRPAIVRTLENTPFYARSLVRLTVDGRGATAIQETVSADRFRANWVRFLLPFRMRRAVPGSEIQP